jgi:outer membrane protein TolC
MNRAFARAGLAALLCSTCWFGASPTRGLAATETTLTLPDALARLRPTPRQLELEADLAVFEQHLGSTSGRLSESPSIEFGAGSRDAASARRASDFDVSLAVPLLARAARRTALAEALSDAVPTLRRFAAAEVRAAAALAYIDAWQAQELEILRREALALENRWLRVAQERFAAGALAGYEVSLLRADQAVTEARVAEAAASRSRTWGDLAAALEDSGSAVPRLAAPDVGEIPVKPVAGISSLAEDAIRGWAAIEKASADLTAARDRSRWSLKPGWAREGEEDVMRLGFAFRIPRGAEGEQSDRVAASRGRQVDRQVEVDVAQLDARRQAAAIRLQSLVDRGTSDALVAASQAIEARWLEGKEGLAEILPARRQLLSAVESELDRRASRARAGVEWNLLSQETEP